MKKAPVPEPHKLMSKPIKAGVVGGTGYTGAELLRLLAGHPQVELAAVTSRSERGRAVGETFPGLRGVVDLPFSDPESADLKTCDLVFYATPNGVAMQQAPKLLEAGVRVIDLAADFRLRDLAEWEQWYGMTHAAAQWAEQAVYGLPELNRQAISDAQLVANPGCYPTAVQLGFWPLLATGAVDAASLIADAKSGVSGAGRKAKAHILFGETADSFKSYAVSGHRHLPEMRQGLQAMTASPVHLTFTPHLTPMIRGIHATLYARILPDSTRVDWQALYEERYADARFVDVLPPGSHPETRSVRASNLCRLAVHRPQDGDVLVVLSVIDNLVKGAAGQAVQNMNLMYGLPEDTGLTHTPVSP